MTTTISTHTLDVPGARLHYDVRGDLRSGVTPLAMVGSPMGAAGFASLASYFPDRPVVTYDPRGVERSARTDGADRSTPQEHAADISAVIDALGVGPVDLFGSSGGAVNGLALVERHPGQVRVFVGHEPPLSDPLPDRDIVNAVTRDLHATYLATGSGPAMAKFLQLVMFEGPLPADYLDRPDPDPAMFGLPSEDDGSRDDALLGQNMGSTVPFVPDYDALVASSTRIVIAAGRESGQQMTARAAAAVAGRLGLTLAVFPSHHGGFLGGEYGQQGDPTGFAAALREALSA